MTGVNKAILVGHLGRDPEVRTAQGGGRVASFSVATSTTWRDKETGERKEATDWHQVVIFDSRLVEVAEKYLRKGSKVWIVGMMQTRKWSDRDGVERHVTEVVLRPFRGELTMLDSAGSGRPPPADDEDAYGSGDSGDVYDSAATQVGYGARHSNPGAVSERRSGAPDDLNDEIPF